MFTSQGEDFFLFSNLFEASCSHHFTCHSLVEQQKRKLAQLEEIEKEAAEKEPSRCFSLSLFHDQH